MPETKTVKQITVRRTLFSRFQRWASDVFPSILAVVAIDLLLTMIFFGVSAPSTHIGTLRPEATIPLKVLQLASVGLMLGFVALLATRSFDLRLLTFGVAFTTLLDLDHLPSFFGVEQPIRPAHSLAFFAITFAVLYLTVARDRPEIPVIFASAFFGHLAADTGVFAFYAPISFDYTSLAGLKIPFAAIAVVLAISAGYLKHRRQMGKPTLPLSNPINVERVSNIK